MIQFIKNFYQRKLIESENKVAEQRAIKNVLETASLMIDRDTEGFRQIDQEKTAQRKLEEATDFVVDRPDSDGFYRLTPQDRMKGHLQPNQLDMVRQARKFYRFDPNGRAAIQTMVNYVMGRGVDIQPKSEDPMVWYIWKEFWTSDRNNMRLKQFEIATRLFRDGEVFIEFFDEDENGKATGKSTIRFLDPLMIKNPGPTTAAGYEYDKINTINGIESDSNDAERVLAYHVQNRIDLTLFRRVPAEKVVHLKIFSDSDQKRGETFIQPAMRMFTQFREWLENRILLNKMRTAIVLIKKVTGTPSQVQAIADSFKTGQYQRSGDDKKQNIRGGTILTAGPGIEYKMESPNINAQDAAEDGRSIKIAMAAGTNMPEYIFGDASNANYSSTMVAEAPMVKSIQYWQYFLEFYYCQIYRRVLEAAVKAGVIEEPSDDDFLRRLKRVRQLDEQTPPPPPAGEDSKGKTETPGKDEQNGASGAPGAKKTDPANDMTPREKEMADLMPEGKLETPTEIFYGADLQWPEIIHRDIKQQTESLQLARNAGWISDDTASAQLGFEYSEEVRKQRHIEEEAESQGNPLLGVKPGGSEDEMSMDNELTDVLGNLDPDERKIVLSKNDPKMIAKMGAAKAAAKAKGGENAND